MILLKDRQNLQITDKPTIAKNGGFVSELRAGDFPLFSRSGLFCHFSVFCGSDVQFFAENFAEPCGGGEAGRKGSFRKRQRSGAQQTLGMGKTQFTKHCLR